MLINVNYITSHTLDIVGLTSSFHNIIFLHWSVLWFYTSLQFGFNMPLQPEIILY